MHTTKKFSTTEMVLLKKVKKIFDKYGNQSRRSYEIYARNNVAPSVKTLRRHTGMTWNEIKEELGFEPFTITSKAKSENAVGEEVTTDYKENSAYITTKSLNIKTVDEALAKAKVDTKLWKVERFVINSWEVTMGKDKAGSSSPQTYTNWQVKVWLKPKIVEPLEEAIRLLIKDIPKWKPIKRNYKFPITEYALEMAPYDVHFGKMAWGKETMQGNYDLKIAREWFLKAIETNLNYSSSFPISKIYYIIGQDLMHAENFQHQTPKGQHSLDVDGRLPKIYKTAKQATIQAIEMCLQVAPVEAIWVPGNHDMHASFFLAEVIKEHYRNCEHIVVDTSEPWRKARLWGNLLVGYTHDTSTRTTNVVNMLPQFWPELWGKSKFREWHCGHKHKKDETKFKPTQTIGGVTIRQIPTLSVIDAWHYEYEFVDAVPGGESFVWSKNNGIVAHYTAFVGHDKDDQ